MDHENDIKVTSHVGRDILSSAAAFKSEFSVVWEYVVNSLQYVDTGISPKIQVNVQQRNRTIEIHDNGSGMDESMLRHFFTMHGENIERKKGRVGRGKFGTGKSAAFGIANMLKVETRKDGVLNVVELSRRDIEKSEGKEIPISWIVQNQKTDQPNGTSIIISEIFAGKIQSPRVIDYIERHLQAFRSSSPSVAVNDHPCQFKQPDITETFVFHPTEQQSELLGNCDLKVHVSRTPLEETERGITVTAGIGNTVGLEDCGISRKEHGSYLFGEIDVPSLETFDTPIEPYDDSRSLQLNPEHPVVGILVGFIGSKLEYVRKEIAKKYREAKQTEEARRLTQAADKIAEVLNEDFLKVKKRLDEIRSAASKSGASTSLFGNTNPADEELGDWSEGIDEKGIVEQTEGRPESEEPPAPHAPRPDPEIAKRGKPDPSGDETVSPKGGEGKKKKPRGGFQVEYEHLGQDEDRSLYDSVALKIIINLDHPIVASAINSAGIEDLSFRRLSYEIAFSEYSMALGYEMAQQDPDIPADDLLYEVRSTLNRISRRAAILYAI
ncbi:ATP-binding protein [Pseudomonadota bacterium]